VPTRLEQAGFEHVELVEIDAHACATLRANRPGWKVVEGDVRLYSATHLRGEIDLLAGGVPCPPFSIAGKQLGADDERDLFPAMLRLASEAEPGAVFIENVPGLMQSRFAAYREAVLEQFRDLGYEAEWRLVQASEFGVPQLRPRALLVATRPAAASSATAANSTSGLSIRSPKPTRLYARRTSPSLLRAGVAWRRVRIAAKRTSDWMSPGACLSANKRERRAQK